MVRSYKYKLYPTKAQEVLLHNTLETLRQLYNAGLQERRDAWKKQGIKIFKYDQHNQLKYLKEELSNIYSQSAQDCLNRLDKAFQAFFRRIKTGETPGYPRFKGKGQFNSFTFPQASAGGIKLVSSGKRIKLSKIGNIKIKIHTPHKGVLKQVHIKLDSDNSWYAHFICDNVPTIILPKTDRPVGIDVGITSFATLSNNVVIQNPRYYEIAQKELATAQRRLSRRKKGSKRRNKARILLAKKHNKIVNIRRDFHHKVSREIVNTYDEIKVEDLNIAGLVRSNLSKQINDAGWGQFITFLSYKAESAGRVFVKVDPKYTSQDCSGCDNRVKKKLSERIHSCTVCGLVLDRDHNAAINILHKAGIQPSGMVEVTQPCELRST